MSQTTIKTTGLSGTSGTGTKTTTITTKPTGHVKHPHESHTGKTILIVLLILIIIALLAALGYWIYKMSKKPAQSTPITPIHPAPSQFPCPPGWKFDGASKCTKDGATIDLNGKTFPDLRSLAVQNNISSWDGVLCPPGWTGIGTDNNMCTKSGAKGSPASFAGSTYSDNPANLIIWAQDKGIESWPGITCPENWSGLGSTANPCVKTSDSQGSDCTQGIFDNPTSYNSFDDLATWAKTDCNLKDPFYGAGLYGSQ